MTIRFPKDIARAQQWRDAIYPSENKSQCNSNGSICIEHFNESDLVGQKLKCLRPNAIPSIFRSRSPFVNDANAVNGSCSESTESAHSIALENPEHDHSISRAVCDECEEKDEIINKLRAKVASMQTKYDSLQKINQTWRQKTYHLKKMQSMLNTSIVDLKKKNMIDSKLVQKLEVNQIQAYFFL